MRHELVENVFPVSQPHYSERQCPFTKPNLTDSFQALRSSWVEMGPGEDKAQPRHSNRPQHRKCAHHQLPEVGSWGDSSAFRQRNEDPNAPRNGQPLGRKGRQRDSASLGTCTASLCVVPLRWSVCLDCSGHTSQPNLEKGHRHSRQAQPVSGPCSSGSLLQCTEVPSLGPQ